ncbi:nickel/cobalt transporter [Phytohabitans kaempferiae]|uniref:Nickel/cobalt efflux system n=1 Tax=Phytohabitans kaempferiae TaxID=1620943 RepID=A0ABV6MCU9_9ACTN
MTGFENRLVTLFDGQAVFWLALLTALAVGAAHAVAPGHGKSVTAAYLVGTRGRYRDALRLGLIVALMHTFSVLVLALLWVGLSGVASLGTETLTAWMQVAAGLVVIAVGAHLLWRHVRRRGHHHHHQGGDHHHDGGHHHGEGHQHGDGHQHGEGDSHGGGGHHHHHEVPEDPWSRRGLVALGLSGGLLPSPSAFVVLVSGLLTGRALGAVVLVIAFGVGMAVTLTAVGVISLRGWALLSGRTRRWSTSWVPALAGAGVCAGGALYLVAAVSVLAA